MYIYNEDIYKSMIGGRMEDIMKGVFINRPSRKSYRISRLKKRRLRI